MRTLPTPVCVPTRCAYLGNATAGTALLLCCDCAACHRCHTLPVCADCLFGVQSKDKINVVIDGRRPASLGSAVHLNKTSVHFSLLGSHLCT